MKNVVVFPHQKNTTLYKHLLNEAEPMIALPYTPLGQQLFNPLLTLLIALRNESVASHQFICASN